MRARLSTRGRDALIVAVTMVLGFLLAAVTGLSERRERFIRAQQESNLDELLFTLLVGLVTYAVIASRRNWLLRRESQRTAAMERSLRETNERYRSLFEYHPQAVFSLDLAGRFTSVNGSAERVSGYTEDELDGMDFVDLLPPESVESTVGVFDTLLARQPKQFEVGFRHKQGRAVDLRITGLPIILGDEVVGVYGIAEDVTEHNRMQAELAEARRTAEEANGAKSLFLANMSHEIRTPLTSVLAAAEVMGDQELDAASTHLVQIMERQGRSLLRLVDEILDFSKIEAGRTELSRVPFSLRGVVEEVVATHHEAAADKGLDLAARVDPRAPDELLGDPERLTQVISNLVGNAVKFTAQGWVRVRVLPGDGLDHVVVQVADSGIGVSPEQQAGLFESFQQADSSITRKYGGTGLGLAICKQLVEAMGGQISVESQPGEGCAFSFTVPLLGPAPSPTTTEAARPDRHEVT